MELMEDNFFCIKPFFPKFAKKWQFCININRLHGASHILKVSSLLIFQGLLLLLLSCFSHLILRPHRQQPDSSPRGSAVPGLLQARTLEWVAISFSNAWKWKVKVKSPSRVRLFVTSWIAAYQAPLSMRFSRQEYWSGLSFPSPEDLPNPGIKPGSPTLRAGALPSEPPIE